MSPAAAVCLSDLSVSRGGKPVLDGLSFDVPGGAVVGLIGPSGCGKTTLLRSIVGVQLVDRGTVTVLGEPAGSAELRHRVAYMTQAPSVYADLSVRENLRYFGSILAVGPPRIDEVLATVDLVGSAEAVVATLSGGERSRVSLAIALLGRPDLLILDEPTVGLDPVLRRRLWQGFHRLADDGAALLVSSHVMDEADRCDQLLLMRAGRIIATGTPEEVRRQGRAATLEEAFVALAERP